MNTLDMDNGWLQNHSGEWGHFWSLIFSWTDLMCRSKSVLLVVRWSQKGRCLFRILLWTRLMWLKRWRGIVTLRTDVVSDLNGNLFYVGCQTFIPRCRMVELWTFELSNVQLRLWSPVPAGPTISVKKVALFCNSVSGKRSQALQLRL
jgi:hypothetical protein